MATQDQQFRTGALDSRSPKRLNPNSAAFAYGEPTPAYGGLRDEPSQPRGHEGMRLPNGGYVESSHPYGGYAQGLHSQGGWIHQSYQTTPSYRAPLPPPVMQRRPNAMPSVYFPSLPYAASPAQLQSDGLLPAFTMPNLQRDARQASPFSQPSSSRAAPAQPSTTSPGHDSPRTTSSRRARPPPPSEAGAITFDPSVHPPEDFSTPFVPLERSRPTFVSTPPPIATVATPDPPPPAPPHPISLIPSEPLRIATPPSIPVTFVSTPPVPGLVPAPSTPALILPIASPAVRPDLAAVLASESASPSPSLSRSSSIATTMPTTTTSSSSSATEASSPPHPETPTTPGAPSTPKSPPVLTKSWASLLRSPAGSPSSMTSPTSAANPLLVNGHQLGYAKKTLVELLEGVELQSKCPQISPRGLVNNGNLCFANTILQCLVFSAPFWNLVMLIKKYTAGDLRGKTPSMDAMILFLEEFHSSKTDGASKLSSSSLIASAFPSLSINTPVAATPSITSNGLIEYSNPFLPEQVYESLKNNTRFDELIKGHQEDAEEFLGFFLDTLHDEILIIIDKNEASVVARNGVASVTVNPKTVEGGDDDWMEVGSKGRTATTRTTETRVSPITKIFGGQMRSILRRPSQKDSITLEPYQRLQLDIQPDSVKTVEDALLNLTLPETLPDFHTGASKQAFLETFPPILILHLKRFLYNPVGGVQKSSKVIGYGLELEIAEGIVPPSLRTGKKVLYQLYAVVYHHGKSATGGHYTVAVRQHATSNNWFEIDDTRIEPISPNEVAVSVSSNRSNGTGGGGGYWDRGSEKGAYLLFYSLVVSP